MERAKRQYPRRADRHRLPRSTAGAMAFRNETVYRAKMGRYRLDKRRGLIESEHVVRLF